MRALAGGLLLSVLACACCGCRAPSREDPFAAKNLANPPAASAPALATDPFSTRPHDAGPNPAFQTAPADPATQRAAAAEQALAAVVAELGDLDEQAKTRLAADLRQTDPRLWPQLLDTFRAAVEFRRAGDRPAPPPHGQVNEPGEYRHGHRSGLAEHAFPSREPAPFRDEPSAPRRGDEVTRAAPAVDAEFWTGTERTPQDMPGVGRSNVQLASFERPATGGQEPLSAAIHQLEADAAASSGDVARQVHLRLLYLAAGRREDALRKIDGLPADAQEYWAAQIYAIATWLDAGRYPDDDLRAAEAIVHLDAARTNLAEIGALEVANLHFCTAVSSYGIFDRFSQYQFRPNQEVILYAEVDNFKSRHEPNKGYHTAIQGQYQIYDSRGQRASEHKFHLMKEHCQNPRRDYFVAYPLRIPDWLYDGQYTLQLTVEDTLARKIGQSIIEFTIQR